MSKEVSQEVLDMVDEVLEEQDPEFLQDVANINPEDFEGRVIANPQDHQNKKSEGLLVKWYAIPPRKKKLIMGIAFVLFIGVPMILLSALGVLTPKFSFSELPSMEYLSDEVIVIDSTKPKINLFSLENDDEFTLKTREIFARVKAQNKKVFVRCSFEIGMANEEDRVFVSKHEKIVIDTITDVVTNSGEKEFQGIAGKEFMKQKILVSLNKKLEGKIKSIHYDQILFHKAP